MPREITAGRIKAARIIAGCADTMQIVLFPFFWPGGVNPIDDLLDVAVGALMIWLVGFHWVFLPAFVMEVVPVADFAPTWTIAVLIATRKGETAPSGSAPEPDADAAGGIAGKVTDVEVKK